LTTGTFKVSGSPDKSGERVTDSTARLETTSALVCEAPQPDKFLKLAINTMKKMGNVNPELFNVYKLAVALAKIDFYGELARRDKVKNIGCVDLISILCEPSFLLYCFSLIKRGPQATGIDNILPTGMTSKAIIKLAQELKTGTYRPKPTKRVMIPKADKSKLRPLGIASTKDKVVQQALKLILEPLYEPIFLDVSYGFRPNKSCHKALFDIEHQWPGTVWLLEFDFRQAFDKINHHVLISQLSRRFHDPRINRIIWSMLKTGYIHLKGLVDSKLTLTEGTPQGSILSPLLCNIYLHQLDLWIVQDLIPRYSVNYPGTTGVRKRISEAYRNAVFRWKSNEWSDVLMSASKHSPDVALKDRKKIIQRLRTMQAMKADVPYYEDLDLYRLNYARFADDFLLGFIGTKASAKAILTEILWFCEAELKMGVNSEKTGISHKSQGVMFLGYKIWQQGETTVGCGNYQRRSRTRLMFTIPVHKLFKKYSDKGFFIRAKKGNLGGTGERTVARRQDKWLFLKPYYIIHRYNAVVRGLINYYKGSERLSDLYHIIYTLRRSAALTLAHHKNKKTAQWAFKTWGPELKVAMGEGENDSEKHVEFYFPSLEQHKNRWGQENVNDISRNLISGFPVPKSMALIQSASELACSIPGCHNQASDWHHLRHKRKIGQSGSARVLAVAFARQIPVCKRHHELIHTGKYDGVNLKKIPGYET
jgi:retron-type reverse transcriptase